MIMIMCFLLLYFVRVLVSAEERVAFMAYNDNDNECWCRPRNEWLSWPIMIMIYVFLLLNFVRVLVSAKKRVAFMAYTDNECWCQPRNEFVHGL